MNQAAQIIIVGDEVLVAEVIDANGPILLAALARLGTRAGGVRIVPDSRSEIAGAVREARMVADIVLVTGGIGPTHDDCTRPALADALGRPLVPHPEALDRLRRFYGDGVTPEEEAMAHLPRGSVLMTSPETHVFGFQVENVFVFPGVPRLLEQLLVANPDFLSGRPRARREVMTKLREGVLASRLAELAVEWPDVSWGSYPLLEDGRWRLKLVLRAEDEGLLDRAHEALIIIVEDLEKASRDRNRSP